MPVIDEIMRLRTQLRTEVATAVLRIFGWTAIAVASPIGDTDAVETSDVGDPGAAQRTARRIEPFGFRSRPIKGARSLWLRMGDQNVLILGVSGSAGYGPQDLEAGESEQYSSKAGARVRIKADGSVLINAPAGVNVVVNDGVASVHREGDGINASAAMTAWGVQVQIALAALGQTIGLLPTGIGTATGGAERFKA